MNITGKAILYFYICLSFVVTFLGSYAYANEITCEAVLTDVSQIEAYRARLKILNLLELLIPQDRRVIDQHNSNVFSMLQRFVIEPSYGRKSAVTGAEARIILEAVLSLAPVQITMTPSNIYDRWNEDGFCFGRAKAVHLVALKYGVNKDAIRKLWAVGNLSNGGSGQWVYHTTTIIKNTNGQWFALDPIFGRVMEIQQWVNLMKSQYSIDGRMMVYETEASREFPLPGKYEPLFAQHRDRVHFYRDLARAMKSLKLPQVIED